MLVFFKIFKNQLYLYFVVTLWFISIFNLGIAEPKVFTEADYETTPASDLRNKLRISKEINVKLRPTSNTTSRGITENTINLHWRYSFGINCPIHCEKYFEELIIFLQENTEARNARCLSNNVGTKIEFLNQESVIIESVYIDSSGQCLKFDTTGNSYIVAKGLNLILRDIWFTTSP